MEIVSQCYTSRAVFWSDLLCSPRLHVEVNVLQIRGLRNLPMNARNIRIWVSIGDVNHKVANGPHKVVLGYVPGLKISILPRGIHTSAWSTRYAPFRPVGPVNVNIAGENSQAYET